MTTVEQAVILVGGRGTRLGSLTAATPKPMLLVGGIPFVEYLLHYVSRFEIRRILFCAGYQGEQVKNYFGDGGRFGFDITYSLETVSAGTAGALLNGRDYLDATFVVLNGDTFFEINLQALIGVLDSETPSRLAAVAVRQVEDSQRYGHIRIQGDSVVSFDEKRGSGPGLVNGGAYCLRKEALDLLPGTPCSIENDLFPQLAATGRLGGLVSSGYFIDIGLPETLARAQSELPCRFAGLASADAR